MIVCTQTESIAGFAGAPRSIAIDFAPTVYQRPVRDAVEKICARFGDDYWLKRDHDGEFPHDFHRAGGWTARSASPIPEAHVAVAASASGESRG